MVSIDNVVVAVLSIIALSSPNLITVNYICYFFIYHYPKLGFASSNPSDTFVVHYS